jgi:hypothetical protein
MFTLIVLVVIVILYVIAAATGYGRSGASTRTALNRATKCPIA